MDFVAKMSNSKSISVKYNIYGPTEEDIVSNSF